MSSWPARRNGRGLLAVGLFACVIGCTASPDDSAGGDPRSGDNDSCDASAWGPYAASDAGGPVFHTIEACVSDIPPNGRVVEYLNFANSGATTLVRIARRWIEGNAVGETLPLELAAFAIDDGGMYACLKCPSQLAYAYGHHNWMEQGTASTDTVQYQLTMVYGVMDGAWSDDLTAVSLPAGGVLWGPERLTAVSCATDPPGNPNFCMLRPRVD